MSLRSKLILTFLLVGLSSAGLVGGIAYGLLMRDFRQSAEDRAFDNFRDDVLAYLERFGSWQEGEKVMDFPAFVRERRAPRPGVPPPDADAVIPRHERAPFRFLLADSQGRVLKPVKGFDKGQALDANVLARARAVMIDGRLAVQAIPIGEPILTQEDRTYLRAIRQAIISGVAATSLLALLAGVLLAKRMTRSLGEITLALRSMQPDGELKQQVPVRGKDEFGMLARAFNAMSVQLAHAHSDLRESRDTVQAQAGELLQLSLRDPLTGLYNRRHFDEQASILYRNAVRHGRPFSVAIGDLDHFKRINDSFSHATGDAALRAVAAILKEHTRASDAVARYGGEEFVLACSESTLAQTVHRCEELRRRIEAHPWRELHPDLAVTISLGVCDELTLGGMEHMLADADRRLYRAKQGGRNRVMPPPVASSTE